MARPFWTSDALASLETLRDYLFAASPVYGRAFLEALIDSVEVLDQFPRIGRVVPELEGQPFREIIFQNYRIVYEIVDERPWILLVVHGSIDLRTEFRRRGMQPP